MIKKIKISVILPTYNEKKSIKKCIADFGKIREVDEIIVINNNAVKGTSEELAGTGAREIFEPVQGYGSAIRRGLDEAKGEYLVICEPDGTFSANDVFKLLSYADDFDFVVGTRTTDTLIWEGANMGFFMKWGNYFLGKAVEFLFNTTQLTDAGCTYRLIKRSALIKIEKQFKGTGNAFGLEMMVLVIKNKIPFIQIPVNYHKRVGQSSVTGNKIKAIILAWQMLCMVVKLRVLPHA